MGKGHHLYVLGTKRDGVLRGPCKVGITKDWRSRLRTIQTSCPNEVGYSWVFNMPDAKIARALEHSFHTVKAEHRLTGEWFDMEPLDAVVAMTVNIAVALEHHLRGFSRKELDLAFEMTRAAEAARELGFSDPRRLWTRWH